MVFTLVTSKMGFHYDLNNDRDFYKYIKENKIERYWDKALSSGTTVSKEFKDLYISMVNYHPSKRPSIDQILNSPWMKEINDLSEDEKNELKHEIVKYFMELKQNYEDNINIQNNSNIGFDDNGGNKGMEDDDGDYFDLDLKPKYIYERGKNAQNYIHINGELEPAKFMNKLASKIQKNYAKYCKIEKSDKKDNNLNIGILLKKQSSKKKNLFRLNQKSIEPLLNIKTNKNNENNKNSQTNSFYNNHNNLQNLVLPFSNTTKNYLFPKNFISSNFITNNKVNNLAQIHMTKNGLIDNKTKIKYSNLLEKIDKKNFTFRNEDNIKISFSSSNNNNDLKQMAKDKNNNKYKFLQISKSNSINNIIKFNNLSNNVNISKKMAKTPNKHLINLLRNDNRGNFGFSKRVEKTNMLYNLIRGIGSPKSKRIKNISYSANPNSIRKHSKNN